MTDRAITAAAGWMTTRLRVPALSMVILQLLALLMVIRQYQLVSPAFLRIAAVAFIGFVIHHFLPLRHRMPFFVLLSFVGIGIVFGPAALWLIAIGLGLVGICYLPVAFQARIGLLVAAGALLAVTRANWVPAPWPVVIWPILGSMFMFRLIVYLYDTQEKSHKEPLFRTLAYFFMLPNVCFPLFPVVDYATFRRNYFDEDSNVIYQRGIVFMVRGITHLIIYRVIYHYTTISPAEVTNAAQLLQYLIATFLLYLQISGQFHLVVGLLHLFGFNLPETNHKFLLSSSFNDFWRRINIYWKDFMLKVFYYPIYFQLRRLGQTWAVVIATILVFIATWLLHSYQWFWIRGSFPIVWQDGVYWMILALLVAANSLVELRYGRQRSLSGEVWTLRRLAIHGVKVLSTMSAILVLWSLWMAESFSAWLALWTVL